MPKRHTQSNKARKRKGKDLDQIYEDITSPKRIKVRDLGVDLDLPGDGQFYCIECSRYFITFLTMKKHKTSKAHKQRLKMLHEPAYKQREANIAGGLGG